MGTKSVSNGRCEKVVADEIVKGKKLIRALNSILWSEYTDEGTPSLSMHIRNLLIVVCKTLWAIWA